MIHSPKAMDQMMKAMPKKAKKGQKLMQAMMSRQKPMMPMKRGT